MQLGDIVQAERKELRLSQEELASRLQRSQDWVSLVERNKQEPTLDDLDKLARELKSQVLRDIANGKYYLEMYKRNEVRICQF